MLKNNMHVSHAGILKKQLCSAAGGGTLQSTPVKFNVQNSAEIVSYSALNT
jgi:hypothetical protein